MDNNPIALEFPSASSLMYTAIIGTVLGKGQLIYTVITISTGQ